MGQFKRIPSWFYSISSQVFGFTLIYYMLFAKNFLKGKVVLGGDTQLVWSYSYLFYRSLVDFGEFPWWDPTTLNGWPAYIQFTCGWYNFLNPLLLPVIFFNYMAIKFFGISVNEAIVFQKTLYLFVLSLIAIILISREIIQNKIARLYIPLVFTICEIQFHFLRDSFLFEGFPPAIFYVYALIRYFNNRTPENLLLYILFAGIFVSSLCYSFLESYLYWVVPFTIFLCLFHKDFLLDTYRLVTKLFPTKKGKFYLTSTLLYLMGAIMAFFSALYFNFGKVIRVSGKGSPIDYSIPWGDFGIEGTEAIQVYPSMTALLNWMPFDDIHRVSLQVLGWGGHDHRYIGLATIPLILVALLRGYKNRLVLPLFLTSLICFLFVIYTTHNVIIKFLADNLNFFKNIRSMAYLVPRDGPSLFFIMLAGIGLDTLLTPQKIKNAKLEAFLSYLLKTLLIISIGLIFVVITGKVKEINHSFTHIGIYLFLFSTLCIVLDFVDNRKKKILTVIFLAATFIDLSLSYSYFWKRGQVWFQNVAGHTVPTAEKIVPIRNEADNWIGNEYRGVAHSLFEYPKNWGGPHFGVHEWVVLATHDRWKPVLENWNATGVGRKMKAYPDFRFYSRGKFIDFDTIRNIDSVPTPKEAGVEIYLHEQSALLKENTNAVNPQATYQIEKFTLNKVRIKTNSSQESYLLFLDNYDPFWTAKVDGKNTPIYRANYTFKTIILPKGEHVVEWKFNPYPIKIAWVLFYIFFFINLGYLISYFRNEKTQKFKIKKTKAR